MISQEDGRDLDWYHGQGLAAFEHSTCGPIIDKLRREAVDKTPSAEVMAARRLQADEGRWDEEPAGAITARPTAEVHESSREEPNLVDLVTYGKVSRRLMRMDLGDQAVLAAYFGDVAARWARSPGAVGKVGRLGPVIALTPAGSALLRRERRGGMDVTSAQLIENVVARQSLHAVEITRGLLATALDEAQLLLERASDSWARTGDVAG